jgi:formate dehydrogenase subunit gamma
MDQTLDRLFEKFKHKQLTLKRLLLDIQASVGILTEGHVDRIVEKLNVDPKEIEHWIRITKSLKLYPSAKHYLKVCHSGHCNCRVDDNYYHQLKALETKLNGDLLIIEVGCLGLCPLGPNVIFDGEIYDHAKSNGVLNHILRQL